MRELTNVLGAKSNDVTRIVGSNSHINKFYEIQNNNNNKRT